MSASTVEALIHYSRGRDKYDAYPEQRTAACFDALAEAVLADRSKGQTWISAPFAQNGDGRHHRCGDGALPRAFLAFDQDGATPPGFAELCMYLSAYRGFGYTTASHVPENPHARFILELSRPVDRAEGIRLGEALQRQWEARLGPDAVKLDPSVYRAEQPCFGPLIGAETMSYFGDPVDVDAVLATSPAAPLRERPATADPYRALIIERGLLLRELGPGKDAVTCPFGEDHSPEPPGSRAGTDTSTVYLWPLHGGYRWGRIHCSHDHCAARNKDQGLYLAKLGLDPKTAWRGQAGGAAPYDDFRGKRWMSPTSSSGLAGVTILDGRVFSHHASDPLADGHAHDAFDLFRILDHGGDARGAVKAAAEGLGLGQGHAKAPAQGSSPAGAQEWPDPQPLPEGLPSVPEWTRYFCHRRYGHGSWTSRNASNVHSIIPPSARWWH